MLEDILGPSLKILRDVLIPELNIPVVALPYEWLRWLR